MRKIVGPQIVLSSQPLGGGLLANNQMRGSVFSGLYTQDQSGGWHRKHLRPGCKPDLRESARAVLTPLSTSAPVVEWWWGVSSEEVDRRPRPPQKNTHTHK